MAPPFRLEQVGREVEQTQIICGFIGCDLMPFNPLLNALPRMIHIPGGYNRGDGWLKGLIQAIRQETDRPRAGNQSVLSRLSELLFIEVVRCYAESLPVDATGWLAALADRGTSRAIHLMHRDPARAWTLAQLAKEVGMSRTVLINRFTGHLGVPPMTYLQNWRMQIAAQMLMDGGLPLSRIAAAVGYESEAAFSRAFKRHTEVSPGMWRKRHLLEEEA